MDKWITNIREFYDGRTTEMLPSAIFGSGQNLLQNLKLQQRIRIGMLPCVSAEEPYVAMGLMTLLAYLLERWGDVRVYRLFFQTDVQPQNYQWSLPDSQHTDDDWVFDNLDENAVLSGKLVKSGDRWKWSLHLQNDLAEVGEEEKTWDYEANSLAQLVNQLEKACAEIIAQFDVTEIHPIPAPPTEADDVVMSRLLRGIFEWQLQLLLVLYGKGWEELDIRKKLDEMILLGNLTRDDFGAWAATYPVSHALRNGYSPIPDSLVTMLDDYTDNFAPYTLYPTILLARALFNAGHSPQAYAMLEAETDKKPQNVYIWLIKADIYRRGGRIWDLVHAYQDAILLGAVNADLYQQYGGVLELLDENPTQMYALIEPSKDDEYSEQDDIVCEAIESYEKAIQLDPERLACLQSQLILLIDLGEEDDRLYNAFETLIEKDANGEHVRAVVETAYNLLDIPTFAQVLYDYVQKHPKRADLWVSLAVLAIHDEDFETAADYLDQAEQVTDDETILADVDRLMMTVDDPEFEENLGNIYAVVSGGNKVNTQTIQFLEDTIEKAPMIPEPYLYLAQSYMIWDKKDHALETIQQGYEQLPDNPEIAELLARYEWDGGNKDEAQRVLTESLAVNPTYVPLMARMGQVLFELGEKDAAKGWLTRAEALSPRDPILTEVRKFIADAMTKN